jgi:hypothetical protein
MAAYRQAVANFSIQIHPPATLPEKRNFHELYRYRP